MLVLEGRAFYRGRLEPLAVGIEHGRIHRVARVLEGDERKDYGDRLLLPGGVDLHVHLREPGMTEKEDFATGTAAAAVGGVTTVLDMPNTRPPVTSPDAYEAKMALVRRKANVDFGLLAAIRAPADVRRFLGLAPAGKLYMAPTTGDLHVEDKAEVRGIVAEAVAAGLLLSVHAEAPSSFGKEEGETLPAHDHMRPPEAEAVAIRLLERAAAKAKGPPRIHIAHVSSAKGLEALPPDFTAEVTPHHLLLEGTMPLQGRGKVNPPLRTAADRKALWAALADGRIPIVASDHAPHTEEEKDVPFREAPAGLPGVETMMPLLLRAVKREELSLERFVDATAKRPAERLGINAGEIEVGRLANLIVVDPRDVVRIKATALHSKCGWSPFEGMEAVFPQATYVRGELAAEARELAGERFGKPIPVPKPS